MKRLALLFAVVIGLALMLNDTSSGGPPPLPATCSSPGCNPTLSDANGNSTRGKHVNQVVVAVAREMAAFAWAIARLVPVAS